jgi:hypothetical protein
MFTNSKDQISLEEAYGSVKTNLINEGLVEIADAIKHAIASTGHMSPQIQALVTMASFLIPGTIGGAATMAVATGVKHLLNRVKTMLDGKSVNQQTEILKDITAKSSQQIADDYVKNRTKENLEAFLNDLKSSLDAAKDSHVDRVGKQMADHLDGKTPVQQESYTLGYLSASGKSKGKSKYSSTLNYLK